MKSKLAELVKDELSGEIAKSYVAQISRFHRVQASTMFHEAAVYIRDTLRSLGLKDAKIEQFPSDGAAKYWTYTSPIGWEVKSAELHMVAPEKKLIVRYDSMPTCLHVYSKSTPAKGIVAELIDVDEGTKPEHYKHKSVKGKFVLTTGEARKVHKQAVYKYGAAGVITDTITREMKNVRESVDIPDAHGYQSIWPTKEELDKLAFGFSISKRQGTHLRALLKNDTRPVILKAKVDARLFPGYLDVVTATIRGNSKQDEEIFFVSHLCHPKPSANDNSSGSGLLIEIARTIENLIETGKIERPKRTIRFLWVPEAYGTTAYLHHHEQLAFKLIAGMNLDMVGQNQMLCKSTLNLDKTPDSNPSYINDYIYSLMKSVAEEFDPKTAFGSASTFRYSINSFSGGSDHSEFNDSTFGVPCVMLLQWPDPYWHTSMDTLDKVSENSLKRVGWIATVAALILANASAEDTVYLANLTRLGAMGRIQEAKERAVEALFLEKKTPSSDRLAQKMAEITFGFKNKIEHIVRREKKAIDSVKMLGSSPQSKEIIRKYEEDIEHYCEHEIQRFDETLNYVTRAAKIALPKLKETDADKEAKRLIPKRLFKGTFSLITLREVLGEKNYEEFVKKDENFETKRYEIFNFMDGKRTVYDIAKALSAEYDETSVEIVLRFLRDLEKANFVSFQ